MPALQQDRPVARGLIACEGAQTCSWDKSLDPKMAAEGDHCFSADQNGGAIEQRDVAILFQAESHQSSQNLSHPACTANEVNLPGLPKTPKCSRQPLEAGGGGGG